MKEPLVTGTEVVGFSGEDARTRRDAEAARLKAEGAKHVIRFTDQKEGAMVYCVSWARTQADVVTEAVAEAETVLAECTCTQSNGPSADQHDMECPQYQTKVPLTETSNGENMVNEGGNTAEEK